MIPLGVTASQSLQEPTISPVPLSGMLYWLEADHGVFAGDGTVVPGDNEGVRLWVNRGSAGNVEQATEAFQPLFIPDDSDSGKPSIYMGQVGDDRHYFSDLVFSQPAGDDYNPWTLFVVSGPAINIVPRGPLLGSDSFNGKMDLYRWGFGSGNPNPMVVAGIPMNEGASVWQQNGTWAFRAESVDTGGDVHVNMRLDGAELVDLAGVPGNSGAVTSVQFGRDSGGTAHGGWRNSLYAFLFYNRFLSSDEVAEVEAYLMGKYVFSYDPEA